MDFTNFDHEDYCKYIIDEAQFLDKAKMISVGHILFFGGDGYSENVDGSRFNLNKYSIEILKRVAEFIDRLY